MTMSKKTKDENENQKLVSTSFHLDYILRRSFMMRAFPLENFTHCSYVSVTRVLDTVVPSRCPNLLLRGGCDHRSQPTQQEDKKRVGSK